MLNKILLWTVAVLAIAYGSLHVYTDALIRAGDPVALGGPLPGGDAVEGKRLAAIAGCSSCHRADLGGGEFIAIPYVARLVAPDLTRARDRYDDAAFLRLLRSGAKADGRYALGMPAQMQQRLTDREVADIVAFVRSVPRAAAPVQGHTQVFPLGRIGLLMGEYKAYEGDTPESAAVLRDRNEPRVGRHLALVACTECHGARFEGGGDLHTPPLVIAKAYSRDQFIRFMRTGKTLAGTESASGIMSEMTRKRFHVMTDAELTDLRDFLAGEPGAPPTPP